MNYSSITSPLDYSREKYEQHQALFKNQPAIIQRFLETQAQHLANALIENATQIRFKLPDRIAATASQFDSALTVPAEAREQVVGRWIRPFQKHNLRDELHQQLIKLEQSSDQAVSISASLIRHAIAIQLIYNVLPAGRTVTYRAETDEHIPSIPVKADKMESAITSKNDAIAEDGESENGRGDLLVPFVPAARIFFLPQWVAFDNKGNLLVNSVSEAEAHLASMQRYISILHLASGLAAYITADEEYQKKRYGILGQLINQGRALAQYKAKQIIATILSRAKNDNLNRGLRLSLPYFDDQELRMVETEMQVIPAGRIMFAPAFVVRAARLKQAKVAQDTRFNPSTRKHLLKELSILEEAFLNLPMKRAIR